MPSTYAARVQARPARRLLIAAMILAGASAVEAQTLNPRIVEFDPSADHSAKLADGQPMVSRYDLEVYLDTASAPFHTVNMGKPSPQSDGKVRFDFSSQVAAWPLPGGTYRARVSAVGPTGIGRSEASNTFAFSSSTSPTTCSYSISPTSASAPAGGMAGSFGVSTGSGCSWSASSAASWVRLGAVAGTGAGSVSFTVDANTSSSSRSASISVGGKSFKVSQQAAASTSGSCSYAVEPAGVTLGPTGGAASLVVTAGSGCQWSAATASSWISITNGAGTGPGTVSIGVAANTGSEVRTGSVAVGTAQVVVTQSAQDATRCALDVSPLSRSVSAAGGSGWFQVSTGDTCTWTAGSDAAWLAVGPTSGRGSGRVEFTAGQNPDAGARSAAIAIGGTLATVVQQGQTCQYTLSATTFRLDASGGPAQVTVTTAAGCPWTAVSSAGWLVPSVAAGQGTANVGFQVKRNFAAEEKQATLTIGGAVVTVTLAAGSGPGAPRNFRLTVAK